MWSNGPVLGIIAHMAISDPSITVLLNLALDGAVEIEARTQAAKSLAILSRHGDNTQMIEAEEALREVAMKTEGKPRLLAIRALGGEDLEFI